jgi:hypothetical protein
MEGSCFSSDRLDATILSCHFVASDSFIQRRVEVKVDSLCISNVAWFSARDKRARLLQLCLFSTNLSTATLTKIKLRLLSENSSDLSGLGLKFSLHFKRDRAENSCGNHDPGILNSSVDALLVVSQEVKDKGNMIEKERRVELCKLLTAAIERKNLDAAILLLLFGNKPAETIVKCALNLSIENRAWAETELAFFATLLKNDFVRLFHPTIDVLSTMASSMSKAWEAGFLDGLLDILFQRARFSSSFQDVFGQNVVPHMIQRVSQSLRTVTFVSFSVANAFRRIRRRC